MRHLIRDTPLVKESRINWTAKKPQDPTGFELTTSTLRGMYSTAVLQPQPCFRMQTFFLLHMRVLPMTIESWRQPLVLFNGIKKRSSHCNNYWAWSVQNANIFFIKIQIFSFSHVGLVNKGPFRWLIQYLKVNIKKTVVDANMRKPGIRISAGWNFFPLSQHHFINFLSRIKSFKSRKFHQKGKRR